MDVKFETCSGIRLNKGNHLLWEAEVREDRKETNTETIKKKNSLNVDNKHPNVQTDLHQ